MFARKSTRHGASREIAPDEIFLDSTNLPALDPASLEGRVERPLSRASVLAIGVVFFCGVAVFAFKSYDLQVVHGAEYAEVSRENRLNRDIVFSPRGVLYDRTGERLAWNDIGITAASSTADTPEAGDAPPPRFYYDAPGLAHVLGFVRYPKRDASGTWWREEYVGVSGAEKTFDAELRGTNGSRLTETDARGASVRSHLVEPALPGRDVALSIDARVQSELFRILSEHAKGNGFRGGAAVIMDTETGELIALTSFPEYDNKLFAEGDATAIGAASNDERTPLLDRAVGGLYTPGSIVKPIFAAAALSEGIISPEKKIHSSGSISVPNPYDPSKPTVFRDWRAHGWTDVREAIAVSSDVYFYTVGGGFGGQKGLGIYKLDEYARRFGLGRPTGIALSGEQSGVIPTPEWKLDVFGPDDPWRLGNTYHTAIGQFGFQITPLQAVRYTAAIANGGSLLTPHLIASSTPEATDLGVSADILGIVREGMRMAVHSDLENRTARSLDIAGAEIAGKTGTAELGTRNQYMNSWAIGFWPASHPRYAFAAVLERAPAGTPSGAAPGMRKFFDWLFSEGPEYLARPEW